MDRTGGLHFILLLLRCVHGENPSMEFGMGIQLFVEGLDSSGPSVLILFSLKSDPDDSPTLVCVVSGSKTPLGDILWWINDTEVTKKTKAVCSSGGRDGSYTATGLWSVAATDWKPDNDYSCGIRHKGKTYRNSTKPSLCNDFT
ncbi:hypothetical protein DPEC_G00271090 [Dallia pectoralis]|uniref:Uncharacterized protein n=1 Tax=Dallia pectoralis TaxID=75939 RepID=A0ACC2FPG6_DALPE|nr:hypothetical protein DPEC_G00271090 [Dallia pectoralis]